MGIRVYEANNGQPLDGLIDFVEMPRAVRLIARPHQKTMHPLWVDILKSLGVTRGVPVAGHGAGSPANLGAAWCLARGVNAVYIGEAQDLSAEAIADCIDFSDRIGASLHLVFGFGQVHAHSTMLKHRGATFTEFEDLAHLIRHPVVHIDNDQPRSGAAARSDTEPQKYIPGDDWPTFRAAYRDVWTKDESEACDAIYVDTMRAVLGSKPDSPDGLAAVLGAVWHLHGCEGHRRLVAIRAAQAAMFLLGWNVRVKERWLERYVIDRHLNPLQAHHHRAMTSVAQPWRSSAAILHAHHVRIPDMLALNLDPPMSWG